MATISVEHIALVETHRFLDWRSGAWHELRKMLSMTLARCPECFRFFQRLGIEFPTRCFAQTAFAASKGSHRHFSECSPILLQNVHHMIVMLWKPYSFNKRSSRCYTVYVLYHRPMQQCYSESRSLAFSGLKLSYSSSRGTVRVRLFLIALLAIASFRL